MFNWEEICNLLRHLGAIARTDATLAFVSANKRSCKMINKAFDAREKFHDFFAHVCNSILGLETKS